MSALCDLKIKNETFSELFLHKNVPLCTHRLENQQSGCISTQTLNLIICYVLRMLHNQTTVGKKKKKSIFNMTFSLTMSGFKPPPEAMSEIL